MTVTVFPSKLKGTVRGISSKSYLHRLLICAALSEGSTEISFNAMSADISATISAISAFGKEAVAHDGVLRVFDGETRDVIDVNESGSTFRFILPLLAAKGGCKSTLINGSSYLASRPISPLYEELLQKGAVISEKNLFPMRVEGQLQKGDYTLPGNISSQFVSGLLLALPMLEGDSRVFIEGKLQSEPYVDITLECMALFGVEAEKRDYGFYIRGNRKYVSPGSVVCQNDYSNAAFFLAAGALSQDFVGVENLSYETCQGDSAVVDILEKFGGGKITEKGSMGFKKNTLKGVSFDASDIPDLVPILALVGAVSKGKTEIYGAERLRFKESDRLKSVSTLLNSLGGKVKETEDGLVIEGVDILTGGRVDSFNDHRIAMTAAIAATVSETPVVIENFEAIRKSYPDFLQDFASVGGKYQVENT